jgi:hypothetical protein
MVVTFDGTRRATGRSEVLMLGVEPRMVLGLVLATGVAGCWPFSGETCTADCANLQDSRECYRDCHYARDDERSCDRNVARDVQAPERGVGYVAPSLRR